MNRLLLALALATGFAPIARASELTFGYDALARNIVLQLMTEGGRYYMQGDPSTPCAYAFVQDPRVDATDGRLRIRLLFSGAAWMSSIGRGTVTIDTLDVQAIAVEDEGLRFTYDLTASIR